MLQLTNPKWWLNMFLTTFMTMIFMYLIKTLANKFNVPVVQTVANEI